MTDPKDIDLSKVLARNRNRLMAEGTYIHTHILPRLLRNPSVAILVWAALEHDPESAKMMQKYLAKMANSGITWPFEP